MLHTSLRTIIYEHQSNCKSNPFPIIAILFNIIFIKNLKQIFKLSFHISANGDKSWILRLFRHLSYREILGISLCFSA